MNKEHLTRVFVGIAESVREVSEEEKALLESRAEQIIEYEKMLRERAAKLSEALLEPASVVFQPLKYRTPETIKRDIKHEKNPMRLKQLNQELNASYKFYKGGK